jgi:hypothetical protein
MVVVPVRVNVEVPGVYSTFEPMVVVSPTEIIFKLAV